MQIPQVIAERVQLKTSLENIIKKILQVYELGEYADCDRFEKGYEELNLKLTTSQGIYVAKIFSQTRSLAKVTDYINGFLEFSKANIPVPKLIKTKNGFVQNIYDSYICLTEFFDGSSFSDKKATFTDIINVTKLLVKIHKLSFKIKPNYDPWGTANLLTEYKTKGRFLIDSDRKLIKSIIKEFSLIDFSKFKKSIIHGDLQKQHVLKNKKGDYCILDLGCMDYNATVIDLAIFLAQFCLDIKNAAAKNSVILKKVLNTYTKLNYLNSYEIANIPLLIKATFAVYLIESNYLIVTGKDESSQTKKWRQLDRAALKKL